MSSGRGGGTSIYRGTSQAAPAAAGVAALVLQANPFLTPAELRTLLADTHSAMVTDPKNGLAFPLIDALNAVKPFVAPDAPSELAATAISGAQIDLSWTDNADNETGFEIQRSPNGSTGWELRGTVGAGVTSFSDSGGLVCETLYYYRVRATNNGKVSAYTAPAGTFSGCVEVLPGNVRGG